MVIANIMNYYTQALLKYNGYLRSQYIVILLLFLVASTSCMIGVIDGIF